MRFLLKFFGLLFFVPSAVFAQQITITGTVKDPNGIPYQNGSGRAILVPTNVFFTVGLTNPVPGSQSPVIVNGLDGNGAFTVTLTSTAAIDQQTSNPQWRFSFCSASYPVQGPICFTGPTLALTSSQDITAQISAVPPPILPGTGGGAGANPAPPNNVVQKNSTGTFAASSAIDDAAGYHFKVGPWSDIVQYGARTCLFNATPCSTGLTATTTAASAVITISNPSTFVVGDGVVIYGAGPPHSMTTPAAPTVTPSVAIGGTGTGLTSPSANGANTRCYKVVARDQNGGLTAASSETCTSTGQTLGANTVNITSSTRSNLLVTVTTAAAHGFLVGCTVLTCGEVYIAGTPTDSTILGWYFVSSATDSTHFTYSTQASSLNDAPASSTGGTAQWFACNHVVWSGVTGAWQYYIYAGASGVETLAGVSRPEGTTVTDFTWDDFGSPMMSNFSFPPYVPTNPPGSATSDHLSTTILSGAGTTSLTLANAAGTSVAGATIRLDAAPAIKAAAAAANVSTFSGAVYIPGNNVNTGPEFVVNSFLDLTPYKFSILQSGPLLLNETVALVNAQSGFTWYGDRLGQFGAAINGAPHSSVDIGTANPGVYLSNTFSIDIEGLTFRAPNVTNGAVLVFADFGGFHSVWRNLNFSSSVSGTNGLMDVGLYLRGQQAQAHTDMVFDTIGLSPGGNNVEGTTHSAGFICNLCGAAELRDFLTSHRGIFWQFVTAGSNLQIDQTHQLGSATPAFTIVGVGNVKAGSILFDTSSNPCFMFSASAANLSLAPGIPCGTNGNVPMATGVNEAIQNFASMGTGTGLGATPNSHYPATNSYGFLGGLPNFNGTLTSLFGVVGNIAADKTHTIFISGGFPAAPSCTVSAGGSLPLASYTFKVVPLWQNNLEGQTSTQSNVCTTTTGNQTININFAGSTVVGNPKGYNLYASQNNGGYAAWAPFAASNPFSPTSSLTFTWSSTTGITSVGATMSLEAGPSMMMPGVQGMLAPAYATSAPPNGFITQATAPNLTANRNTTWQDASGNISLTIASGTAAMTTAAIASLACGTVVTASASGALTTDTIIANDNAQPAAATNGVLTIKSWPTANNANFFYCNPTAGSVTPAAATLNWRVVR